MTFAGLNDNSSPFFCAFLQAAGAHFSFIELPIESVYCLYCSIVHSLQTCDCLSYGDKRNRLECDKGRGSNVERAFTASLDDSSFLFHWLILTNRHKQEVCTSWTSNKRFLQQHWPTQARLISLFNQQRHLLPLRSDTDPKCESQPLSDWDHLLSTSTHAGTITQRDWENSRKADK